MPQTLAHLLLFPIFQKEKDKNFSISPHAKSYRELGEALKNESDNLKLLSDKKVTLLETLQDDSAKLLGKEVQTAFEHQLKKPNTYEGKSLEDILFEKGFSETWKMFLGIKYSGSESPSHLESYMSHCLLILRR